MGLRRSDIEFSEFNQILRVRSCVGHLVDDSGFFSVQNYGWMSSNDFQTNQESKDKRILNVVIGVVSHKNSFLSSCLSFLIVVNLSQSNEMQLFTK